ncbi:MAG: response regulator [Anaerolineae bacterium]|nr:response regulator [Anaerolineae bacterium]
MKENGQNILFVEDVRDMAKLMELILKRARSDTIRVAPTWQEACTAIEQDPPDLIIVRIMMCETDGYEICRRLKAMPAAQHIPVLLQAAMDPKFVYPKAQQAGADGYLYQPYGPAELVEARDALLRGETYYPPLPQRLR